MIKKYASAKILFAEAEAEGLEPVWESPRGLFSFAVNARTLYVYYTKLHLNSQLGSWICQDKCLARRLLEKEGFRNIPYCDSAVVSEVNAFLDAHTVIIQKPSLGERSRDVRLVRQHADIDRTRLEDSIFERYTEGIEYRCLVLNGKTIAMQKKVLEPTPKYPWRKHVTNLPIDTWKTDLPPVAEAIAHLLHMGFIAVDFIIDAAGTAWILELNAAPGLYSAHHPDAGEPLNIAKQLLAAIVKNVSAAKS